MPVEFDEPEMSRPRDEDRIRTSGGAIIKFLMRSGFVRTDAQANVILVLVAIVAAGLSVYVFIHYVLG